MERAADSPKGQCYSPSSSLVRDGAGRDLFERGRNNRGFNSPGHPAPPSSPSKDKQLGKDGKKPPLLKSISFIQALGRRRSEVFQGSPRVHKQEPAPPPSKHTKRWWLAGTWSGIFYLRLLKRLVSILMIFSKPLASQLHKHLRDKTALYYNLPPVQSYDKAVFRRVPIMMRDGNTELHATLATPGGPEKPRPTVLVRTPYCSKGQDPVAMLYLERGFNYMIQDTRGRFDSGGDFFPIQDERQDGHDTVGWIRSQSWSDGRVGVHGVSYMGMTALAAASDPKYPVETVVPVMASSEIFPVAFPADQAIAAELLAMWTWLIVQLGNQSISAGIFILEACTRTRLYVAWDLERLVNKACKAIPLKNLDQTLVSQPVNYIRDGLSNPKRDLPFWSSRNQLADLSHNNKIRCNIHFVGGWHDIFVHQQLEDYRTAREAGLNVRLTVGRWCHWDVIKYFGISQRIQMHEYLRSMGDGLVVNDGEDEGTRAAEVRVWLSWEGGMGEGGEWRGYHEFPPESEKLVLSLSGGMGGKGKLVCDDGLEVPKNHTQSWDGDLIEGEPLTSYLYDPNDPTPSVGGSTFNPWNSGVVDSRRLESRDDVIIFTSSPLALAVDVVGFPSADVTFSSDLPSADLVIRMSDVSPDGKSTNICDGHVRVNLPINTPSLVSVKLGGCAHRFMPGHRIRLSACSGAHPCVSRNLGTLDALGEGVACVAGMMNVHHGGEALASRINLPVCRGTGWPIPPP